MNTRIPIRKFNKLLYDKSIKIVATCKLTSGEFITIDLSEDQVMSVKRTLSTAFNCSVKSKEEIQKKGIYAEYTEEDKTLYIGII